MSDPCEIVSSTATAASTAVPSPGLIAADAPAKASDLLVIGLAVLLTASAAVSDGVSTETWVPWQEHATASSAVTLVNASGLVARDSAKAVDRAYPSIPSNLSDAAQAADAAFLTLGLTARDSAAARDAALPANSPSVTLYSAGAAKDRVVGGGYVNVADVATVADAVTLANRPVVLLHESATVSDAVDASIQGAVLASDSAVARSSVVLASSVTVIVRDQAVARSALPFDTNEGAAWVASTDTFAMSRYEAFPFNSIAVVDGVLLGLGDDGAYQLAGDDDAGSAIDARLDMGITDTGDPRLKRAAYVYFGYQTAGNLRFLVGNTQGGAEQEYGYALTPRRADDPVPGRARLGRGIKTRYQRFSIANIAGADFAVFDVRVPLDDTSRKV